MDMRVAYFLKAPRLEFKDLQAPRVVIEAGGEKIREPIVVAADGGGGVPIVSAVVGTTGWTGPPPWEDDPAFLGYGIQGVAAKRPDLADRVRGRIVQLPNGERARAWKATALPPGAIVLEDDLPLHTFAGYDPETGEPIR